MPVRESHPLEAPSLAWRAEIGARQVVKQHVVADVEQIALDDANDRGVAARIEFRSEGHAKVTFTISREFVETARALR